MAARPQPLHRVLVLDLSEWVAGPFCTKLLADFGARVIKVERPGGDPARCMGPYAGDTPNPEAGGLFLHLNTNKESVMIDLNRREGAEVVRALAQRADVVVTSHRPGVLAGSGLEPADLLKAKPDVVVTSMTAFGHSGPYREWEASEIVAFAMGGPMSASGNPLREPVKLVGNVVQMHAGANACAATLAALYHAQATGVGQHVDVAAFETQNGSLDRRRYYLLSYEYSGTVGQRAQAVGAGRPAVGGRYRASDGREVTTGRIWPDHVPRMVAVIGDDELSGLWDAHGPAIMHDHAKAVDEVIRRWVVQRPARQAMREAQAGGWPVVVVNDPESLLSDEHLIARGFWPRADHPVAGELPYTGPPWRVDGAGWALRRSAPLLGRDTTPVLTGLLGLDEAQVHELRVAGAIG